MKLFASLMMVGVLGPGMANAAGIDDFKSFLTTTQSARADFTQTVHDVKGKLTQQAKGKLVFVRPGKFRWTYFKPAQSIVGDGQKVSFFDEDLNQVTIRKLEKAFASTPAALLAGKSEVEAAFTLVAAADSEGMSWVNAEPKSTDSGIEKVRLGFAKSQLAAMELFDAFGNRTRLDFSMFERNPKIDPKDFVFIPPKGADVVSE
jgi:outer membrane lipoprotein carrier protein